MNYLYMLLDIVSVYIYHFEWPTETWERQNNMARLGLCLSLYVNIGILLVWSSTLYSWQEAVLSLCVFTFKSPLTHT